MCTKPSTCDASKLLEEANRDVVVHILGFLSAFELTVIGQVSRKYQSIAQSQQLWSDLRLPRSETEAATPPSSSCKVDGPNTGRLAFFQALRCAYDSVLGDESRLVVRLHGALYDLSLFLNEHPGGEGLLLEYRARDATVMYERVSHSPLAREIAEHFVVFRTSDYTGRKGWPAFAKHPSVSETQS
ncbi:hypothetical protein B484DRAFT_359709 [Ochromonadaceae sp. CCMP2298]|nr:hypothetical protein B484DRAFT_359709 [Ochromonadaceae sp. CCMP2298]